MSLYSMRFDFSKLWTVVECCWWHFERAFIEIETDLNWFILIPFHAPINFILEQFHFAAQSRFIFRELDTGAESPTTDRKVFSPKLSSRCFVQRHDHKVISPWCQFWPHNMSQQDLCFCQKMALLLVLFSRFNECFWVRGFKFGFQGMKKKMRHACINHVSFSWGIQHSLPDSFHPCKISLRYQHYCSVQTKHQPSSKRSDRTCHVEQQDPSIACHQEHNTDLWVLLGWYPCRKHVVSSMILNVERCQETTYPSTLRFRQREQHVKQVHALMFTTPKSPK